MVLNGFPKNDLAIPVPFVNPSIYQIHGGFFAHPDTDFVSTDNCRFHGNFQRFFMFWGVIHKKGENVWIRRFGFQPIQPKIPRFFCTWVMSCCLSSICCLRIWICWSISARVSVSKVVVFIRFSISLM